MYCGHLGQRHADDNNLLPPARDREQVEIDAIVGLHTIEGVVRQFVTDLPGDVDGRCKAAALTKLDEMVMWLKRGIDA